MSSTSLLSSIDCFTDKNRFSPSFAIDFNRYAQNDNTDVLRIPLCQTEGSAGCNGLAYVVRHPDYVHATTKNDIALIILPALPPIVQAVVANIPNVALNRNGIFPVPEIQWLEAFGWGLISNKPNVVEPNEIQTAKFVAVTNEFCKSRMKPKYVITNDMLCATNPQSETAKGDSGGPLVAFDFNGMAYQVGVVSFGEDGKFF
ncbi:hypothetical protein ACHAW5_011030 [Stephanodiscus triporus]|uniref:Peptidase S1 domain-containing protein n=1 Tax=Stephanodiscus triporus TaxID=2934178 RepID=A0ABD3QFW3_9STRA